MYELLTGQLPHKATDKEQYMKMMASRKVKPAPPSHINQEIPRELDEIVLRSLEKDPENILRLTNMFLEVKS